jgi:hypothetical protein
LLNPTKNIYEQGGMVKKYVEGGEVDPYKSQIARHQNVYDPETETWDMGTVYDTYAYDGVNWQKTGTVDDNPNFTPMSSEQMAQYRSEDRTIDVGARFMATQGGGINEFLRSPKVANLINQARTGDNWAMENLVELARQSVPELANKTNEDLRTQFKKTLTHIDLYGDDYKGVMGDTSKTLGEFQDTAQTTRAKTSSMAALSGIRTGTGGFRGDKSISENLYSQIGDEYSNMQKGIKSGFEDSFGAFEQALLQS